MEPTALYFGRQPNDPHKPRARLRRLTEAPLTVPPAIDWVNGITDWGMLGNDQVGDCTAAGAAHENMSTSFYGAHTPLKFTDSDALSFYSAISGYDPADPSTDVGATLQDALGYWRKVGIGRHKILAFAQIDHTDLDLVRACIAIFGGVYTGLNVPQSAIDQFNQRASWTLPSRASQIVGGHCVPVMSYDYRTFQCVTWGRPQKMSTGFFKRYFDEVWVPFSDEWLSRTDRRSPTGLDISQLNAEVLALTGTPGPFQTPPAPADNGAVDLLNQIQTLIQDYFHDQS